jgi:hypothetical protein
VILVCVVVELAQQKPTFVGLPVSAVFCIVRLPEHVKVTDISPNICIAIGSKLPFYFRDLIRWNSEVFPILRTENRAI